MPSKWIVNRVPNPDAELRLICFPYAGGDASVFRDWYKTLPDHLEMLAVQLPGRSNRLFEPAIDCMNTLVRKVHQELLPYLDKPYVLLGHSLGSKIAFELLHQLSIKSEPLPIHYIASGSRAPHLPRARHFIHNLPDQLFIKEIAKLNGTPDAILKNRELMDLLLPMLRADFCLADTYSPGVRKALEIPVSVFNGKDDYPNSDKQKMYWQQHFTNEVDYQTFKGGHFFINDNQPAYMSALCRRLDLALV
jgi:medium-chain acyl-[acyl-carrier-protein] hydrolase